jgi:hypothetical protein
LILGSVATLYAYGELIDAIIVAMSTKNAANIANVGLKLLGAWVASADAQDAANDLAMEVKGVKGNSNLIGLQLRRWGLSNEGAQYAKTALYIANFSNAALISGGFLRKVAEGGLIGWQSLEIGKTLAEEARRVIEIIFGPFVMKPDPDVPHQ